MDHHAHGIVLQNAQNLCHARDFARKMRPMNPPRVSPPLGCRGRGTVSLQAFPHHLFAADAPKAAQRPRDPRRDRHHEVQPPRHRHRHQRLQLRSTRRADSAWTAWRGCSKWATTTASRSGTARTSTAAIRTCAARSRAAASRATKSPFSPKLNPARRRRCARTWTVSAVELGTDYLDIVLLHCLTDAGLARTPQGGANDGLERGAGTGHRSARTA